MTRTIHPRTKEKRNAVRRNILNLAFLAVLALGLLTGLVVTALFPHDVNEYENRYAVGGKHDRVPVSIAAIRDGSFQDGVENAFADQLPFAERMKAAYNNTFSSLTANLLPKLLAAKTNTNTTPGGAGTNPGGSNANPGVTGDPNGAQNPNAGNDPNANTGNDPNGENNPNGSTDGPNGGNNPNGGTDGPNGGTNNGGSSNAGTPALSASHEPQPEVPGQARIYLSEKTSGGRIILNNVDPSKEVPIYASLTDKVSLFRSHLVYSPYPLAWYKKIFDDRAATMNAYMAAHPELSYYAYFVERETEIDLVTGEKTGTSDYIMSALDIPADRKGIFRVNGYDELDEYFYKGDHHWNYKGSYEGYRQMLRLVLPDAEPILPTAVKSAGLANGSKTKGAAANYCEELSGYVFDFPAFEVTNNGEKMPTYGYIANFFRQTEQNPAAENYTNYANCYGGDSGLIVIRNPESANGNILMIGESYDNAVLNLMACHFSELHSVDLRNYKAHIGSDFHMADYIREHNITKVFWSGCIDFWTATTFDPED